MMINFTKIKKKKKKKIKGCDVASLFAMIVLLSDNFLDFKKTIPSQKKKKNRTNCVIV